MRTRTVHVLVAITVCVALALGGLSWHWHRHAMQIARASTAGDASVPQHVLIATQGSAFKDVLVSGAVKHLSERGIYVQVIDVSDLSKVHASDWGAIALVHTWEFGKPPPAVQAFIDALQDRHRLVAVTTSGSGREKLPGVDAISGASVPEDVPTRVGQLDARLDAILGLTPSTP